MLSKFCRYLLSMESKADMEDYLEDLLDKSNSKHQKFIQELIKRWLPKSRAVTDAPPDGAVVCA